MDFDKALEIIKEYKYPFLTEESETRKNVTIVRKLDIDDVNNKLLLLLKDNNGDYVFLVENSNGVGYRRHDLDNTSEEEFREVLNSLKDINYLSLKEYEDKVKEIQDRFITITRAILGNEDNEENKDISLKYFNTDCTLPVFEIYTNDKYAGRYMYVGDSEGSTIEMIISGYLGMTDEEYIEKCRTVMKYRDKNSDLFKKSREK